MGIEQNNSGSSTVTVDPIELQTISAQEKLPQQQKSFLVRHGLNRIRPTSSKPTSDGNSSDRNESLPSPTTAVEHTETWKSPAINMYRVPSTFWAFALMGMNDATYGAIIYYLVDYYGLSYTIISLVFLSPFVGYNLSAVLNNMIHMKFGRRGVAIMGPLCHILAYIIIVLHPPFPVLVLAYCLSGFGNGLLDAAFNAWIGVMANANEMLGFLHGFYGLGATIAPLIATTMITKAELPWFYWYYVMLGGAVVELGICVHAFWSDSGARYREDNPRTSDENGSRFKEALTKAPFARVTWLAAIFLLGYVGIEVALGGWVVTFMIDIRGGAPFASGMTATGFWLGITLGRVILGFVTPKIGEKLAISIYLPLVMAFELCFWLIPQFYVSAVAVAMQGFFLGPLFPAAIVACTKLLPKHLHVSAIGFAAAFGGSGGAIFPFAVGALASSKGVAVLQPIVLAMLAAIWIVWLGLPRIGKKSE